MSASKDIIKGVVEETLPNAEFKVNIDGKLVRCYLSGKMYKYRVRVGINDIVEVVLAPDGSLGRIVRRK